MTTQPKQQKNPLLKSRVLNANALNNQQVQNYQKQVVEKAKKDIAKIEEDTKMGEFFIKNMKETGVLSSLASYRLDEPLSLPPNTKCKVLCMALDQIN